VLSDILLGIDAGDCITFIGSVVSRPAEVGRR